LFNENLTTAIISSTKIGCSISGCLGRIIIWQNDGSLGWISKPIDENMAVTHLALLEPTDDPRPFYYLWVVFQDESSNAPPILRMYAMLFGRKYCDRGMNLYFNLEADPSLKFESELGEGDKVINLSTVERESNPEQTESGTKRGEDNLLLIATNDKVLLFDLNQWYKEQMPRTINECQNPNSILAIYRTQSDMHNVDNEIVNFAYVPLSLQEFPSNGPSSPEELFYPNSLSLEWIELSSTKLTFWMTRGIQADLLREIMVAGPSILLQPSETFHRCLSAGLVPCNTEFSFTSDQNAQREMLLSLCLEQRWSIFLVKCAMEWSDGSASYLYPTFLKWGIQRASEIKMIADRLCIPLFDQSGNNIGESDVKTLRFCSQQLECLSSVVGKLPFATTDLLKQRRTLERVSTYFQVLIWFYDVGLLPETQDLDEDTLPISLALKVPYPYEKLLALYKEKRIQAKNNDGNENDEGFFIDELITRECSILKAQWEREGGTDTGGCYPPSSLQSLLRSYLTDCHQTENEINYKHQITIYLLMDLAMLLQRFYPAVDQLIKYPSAFKMSPSLIKLTQAFWLLDHEDYQGFLDMMTGQLVSDFDVKDWHHRLILRTLIRNNQHKLALVYLRVRKPPLSSMEEQGVVVSLSVEHGLVQSAFHRRPPCHYEQLLTCFFQACKKYGKLDEILHLALDSEEEEMFVKFLEKNKTEDLRILYYLQRCRYTEAISGFPIRQYQSNFTKDMQSTSLNMLGAYNATLPDVTKRFTTNAAATYSDMDLETHYPRPMSHCKSHDKLRSIHETVITKARETYLRGEKCQIPFVSSPCMSLKLSNQSANINCVLFPKLVHESRKRTMDQIYEEEEIDINDMPDGVKRRKLLDGSISPSKTDTKSSGLTTAFETPLVKRKLNISTNKNNVSETPQSILKIRQLIRSSTSPSPTSSESKKVADKLEKDQKVNRQIRFNISQSKKVLTYSEKEQEEEKEEEKEDDDKSSVSDENKFSQELSNTTGYNESTILNNNSNLSNKSYCYPRPRRSLRRSALQSSIGMSQEESMKKATSDLLVNPPITVSSQEISKAPFDPNVSSRRTSLLSASVYSSTVLSSDSSVDDSYSRELDRSSLLWRLSMEKDRNNKFTISSTPLTKRIASQTRLNDEHVIQMDDNEENTKSDSFVSDIHNEEEDISIPCEFKKSYIDITDYNKSNFKESNNLEKDMQDVQGENQESENKYNNGSITKGESSNPQNSHDEQAEFLELEKLPRSSPTVSDGSDEELLQLQLDENSDEHEAFKSLSTTPEDMQLQDDVFVSHSSDWKSSVYKIEKHAITKSNGLQETMQVITDVDLTDDETSRDVIPISDEADNDKKDKCSTIDTEHIFYDVNITDDESDSSTREIEEQKSRNGKISNMQKQYITQNIEMKNDKRDQKSIREESVSKEDIYEIPFQSDNMSIQSSYKASSSRTEMLETENFSKDTKSQLESKDEPLIRMTRSRRASSIAKDTMDTTLQQTGSERITRQRRGSSMVKDTTIDSPLRNIVKSSRSRRANSVTKDSPIVSSLQDVDTDEPPRLRRMTSILTDSPRDSSSEENPEKPPRLRRAVQENPITKEIKIDSPRKPRGRRASSLVKDVLMNSVIIDEDLRPGTPRNSDTPSVRRNRRSTSVTKEILQTEVKDNDNESIKDELPIRRSARLTSSTKKASLIDVSKNLTRSESASSLSKLTSDEEEEKNTRKRSLRTRKSSVSSEVEKATTNRSLRSSKTDIEIEEAPETPKTNRRRGSSVPKEITVQTGRRRRSNSIIKEIIPEVTESPQEPRKLRSSATKNTDEYVCSTMRRRSASILSIPEELEEILSPSSKKTRSTRSETARSKARERRALSADVSHRDIKRRTRAIHTSITEPILEESVESKNVIEEIAQHTPISVRIASTTIVGNETESVKRKRSKQRNISRNQGSSNVFSFSQPENIDDAPLDKKGKLENAK